MGFMKMTKPFYLFLFCLLLVPVLAVAQDESQTKKTTIEQDSLSTISGTIVCITEELAKIRKIDPECEKYGCLYGLKTSDKTIWSFHRNEIGQKLRKDSQYRGMKIQILGRLIHKAKIIEVHEFKILSSKK